MFFDPLQQKSRRSRCSPFDQRYHRRKHQEQNATGQQDSNPLSVRSTFIGECQNGRHSLQKEIELCHTRLTHACLHEPLIEVGPVGLEDVLSSAEPAEQSESAVKNKNR